MSKHEWGLTVGAFLGILHAVWSFFVAVSPTNLFAFMVWVLGLHHIEMQFAIMPFEMGKAITLVALTFVFGYIYGYLIAWLVKSIARKR